MRYDVVLRVRDTAPMGRTLVRDDLTFATAPIVGDVVVWDSGWGGLRVVYRYVGRDWIELGCGAVGAHEVADFVAAGWVLR